MGAGVQRGQPRKAKASCEPTRTHAVSIPTNYPSHVFPNPWLSCSCSWRNSGLIMSGLHDVSRGHINRSLGQHFIQRGVAFKVHVEPQASSLDLGQVNTSSREVLHSKFMLNLKPQASIQATML
eukprot:7382063-Prymnesium_polylepis.1